MTPAQLSKNGTEHGHQQATFAYCAVAYLHGWEVADDWCNSGPIAFKKSKHVADGPPAVPALRWYHAIHNQGHGDAIRGANAKAEGVRKGIADTFLPWPNAGYAGLYIEMKKPTERPKTDKGMGGVSKEQKEFGEYAKSVGYGFAVCYDWQHAVSTLRSYIEWSRPQTNPASQHG